MKRFVISVLVICFGAMLPLSATDRNKSNENVNDTKNLLIVSFGDKISSNYYPRVDIARKLNTGLEDLDVTLNQKFLDSFSNVKTTRINLIRLNSFDDITFFRAFFSFTGADDELYPVPDNRDEIRFKDLMVRYDADFLIIYSQYFLKRQENPFNTLFHILNFKLFDSEMTEIFKGQEYFNTFDLVTADELTKQFQKAVRKNISSVLRYID